jgi:predicted transcriptional regulator
MSNSKKRDQHAIEGIKRGLKDMREGRVVKHKVAIRRLRATVARIAKSKS